MQLEMLPPDLAGMVRELQSYDFASPEAQQRFEELVEKLRQQVLDSYVNRMTGAVESMTPEDMARMKDMMAELNQMLEQRARGEEPDFDGFMERYGDFFPENPQTLDELLEVLARRMAAMQAMLASMTPEQRAQISAAGRPAARGHGPALAGRPARQPAPRHVPRHGLGPGLRLPRPGPDGPGPGRVDARGAGRPRPARAAAAQRRQPRGAGRGRHRPGPRAARRRRRPQPRRAGPAHPDAAGRRAHRPARGPPRADAQGPAPHRPQRAQRPVREAGPRQAGPPRARAHRRRPRAQLRDQALRVRRPVQPPHRAHGPQRGRPQRRRHAGAPVTPTTSRSSAPSSSCGRRPC